MKHTRGHWHLLLLPPLLLTLPVDVLNGPNIKITIVKKKGKKKQYPRCSRRVVCYDFKQLRRVVNSRFVVRSRSSEPSEEF
jgi:hypothetical protein